MTLQAFLIDLRQQILNMDDSHTESRIGCFGQELEIDVVGLKTERSTERVTTIVKENSLMLPAAAGPSVLPKELKQMILAELPNLYADPAQKLKAYANLKNIDRLTYQKMKQVEMEDPHYQAKIAPKVKKFWSVLSLTIEIILTTRTFRLLKMRFRNFPMYP